MAEASSGSKRGASRSAALVAACRMLEAELPGNERLFDDSIARLVVDEAAIAAARADPQLRNVIRLRTRYIDDAVAGYAAACVGGNCQVLLLGAGLDGRAYRMHVAATVFEVDFAATLDHKAEMLAGVEPIVRRVAVPVDLAEQGFVEPLVDAGFDRRAPTIIVWEGVSMYLDPQTAEDVVAQMSNAVPNGSQLVADYAEMSWFKGSDFERTTESISTDLRRGGEPLEAGLHDVHGTLGRYGFEVTDDVATEELRPRYGLEPLPRHYPTRMLTALRVA
jgi:methyltransferase (TIGR00027 family)